MQETIRDEAASGDLGTTGEAQRKPSETYRREGMGRVAEMRGAARLQEQGPFATMSALCATAGRTRRAAPLTAQQNLYETGNAASVLPQTPPPACGRA